MTLVNASSRAGVCVPEASNAVPFRVRTHRRSYIVSGAGGPACTILPQAKYVVDLAV